MLYKVWLHRLPLKQKFFSGENRELDSGYRKCDKQCHKFGSSCGKACKNAVGVTGIVVLLILCAAPLLKLWVSEFAYKGLAAVLQPISDKRIVNCLSITADAIKLLAYAVGLAGMFLRYPLRL